MAPKERCYLEYLRNTWKSKLQVLMLHRLMIHRNKMEGRKWKGKKSKVAEDSLLSREVWRGWYWTEDTRRVWRESASHRDIMLRRAKQVGPMEGWFSTMLGLSIHNAQACMCVILAKCWGWPWSCQGFVNCVPCCRLLNGKEFAHLTLIVIKGNC